MRWHKRDIFGVRVKRSGISFSPELEVRLAAQWWGYTWRAFRDLDGDEQSELVAVYRVSNQIEAVLASDAAAKSKAKGKP